MSDSTEFLSAIVLRTTICGSVMCIGMWLLLRATRVRNVQLERLAWTLVLLQGWVFFQFPIELPSMLHRLAIHRPLAPHQGAAIRTSGTGSPQDETIWSTATPETDVDAKPVVPRGRSVSGLESNSVASGWTLWLVTAWLLGSLLAALIAIVGYVRFVRSRGEFEPAPEAWSAQWVHLLQEAGIRAPIPLWTSRNCGPLLCRLPRGYVVIVPRPLWETLTASQRHSVLLHEIAHYQRGDVWKSAVARLLAWPQWFNPFVWYAVQRFDECAECACDQRVVASSPDGVTDYARALLTLAHPAGQPAFSSAAGGRVLAARVRRLLTTSERKESSMKNVLQGTLFMLVAALGVLRMELAADEKLPLNATQGSDVTGVVRETDAGPSPGDGVNDPKIAVEPPVSGPHDAGPSPVAVADSDEAYVDTKRLFSEDPQFLDGRKKLDKAVAEIEEQMKASAEEISQHQSKLSKLKSDPSADRDEISALEKLATELEARLAVDQKVIRRKIIREEAELYGVTYDRIRSAIADYARKNGIRIVRRKQAIFSEPLTEQPTNAQEILARVNQDILFNADEPRDITEPVLELLKKQAEQAE